MILLAIQIPGRSRIFPDEKAEVINARRRASAAATTSLSMDSRERKAGRAGEKRRRGKSGLAIDIRAAWG